MDGAQQHQIVYRLFVPAAKVGPIIGKEGANIKALREETHARIKISSPAHRGDDRVMIISTREVSPGGGEPNPAEVAFRRVYPQALESPEGDEGSGSLRLVVAASQAGALIGRGGASIKAIRESSGATVRVNESNGQTPSPSDRICVIQGRVENVESALSAIINILNTNPAHEPLEELDGGAGGGGGPGAGPGGHPPHGMAAASAAAAAAAYAAQQTASLMAGGGNTWSYAPQGGQPSSLGLAPSVPLAVVPGTHTLPMPGVVPSEQVRVEMRVPNSAVGAILGRGGSTINSIRQMSGATIKIRDSEGGATDRLVEIVGSSSQVNAAQSLMQTFVAQGGVRP